jgi:hypothetical protein
MNAEDADTCQHCGTAFFFAPESLERSFDDPADELVVVGRYSNLIQANHVKTLIESQGIEACIPEGPSLFGGTSPIEIVTVRVAAKNAEAAKQIVAGQEGA